MKTSFGTGKSGLNSGIVIFGVENSAKVVKWDIGIVVLL
jgi:hypothetical protein